MTEPTHPSTTPSTGLPGGPVDDRRDDPPPPAVAERDADGAATEAEREVQATVRSISRLEESN